MLLDFTLLHRKRTPVKKSPFDGGDEWIRTTDSRIFSPMLYHLSYITSKRGCKSRYFIY